MLYSVFDVKNVSQVDLRKCIAYLIDYLLPRPPLTACLCSASVLTPCKIKIAFINIQIPGKSCINLNKMLIVAVIESICHERSLMSLTFVTL